MKILETYEEVGKVLGPEEVGQKILPGIIPMLISAQLTKSEFSSLMGTIRRLLDQIELHRLPSLPTESATAASAHLPSASSGTTKPQSDIFAGLGNEDPFASGVSSLQPAETKSASGELDFFA